MAEQLPRITPDMLAENPFCPTKIDFEEGMSAAPLFALLLIAANAAVFWWELSAGALKSREAIIAAGAIFGDKVFAGESWRLGTGMFMHAGFAHLIGNCLVLYILGLASERAWGRLHSFLIYFGGGLLASFASALMQPKPSVGASGAIFALFGAVVVFFYRYRYAFYDRDMRIGGVLMVWGLLQLALGLTSSYVDNWAHIGGAVAGVAFGLFLPSRLVERTFLIKT